MPIVLRRADSDPAASSQECKFEPAHWFIRVMHRPRCRQLARRTNALSSTTYLSSIIKFSCQSTRAPELQVQLENAAADKAATDKQDWDPLCFRDNGLLVAAKNLRSTRTRDKRVEEVPPRNLPAESPTHFSEEGSLGPAALRTCGCKGVLHILNHVQ